MSTAWHDEDDMEDGMRHSSSSRSGRCAECKAPFDSEHEADCSNYEESED